MTSRQLNSDELARRQNEILTSQDSQSGAVVIAENIHTPENLASIIRVADSAGCPRVIFINEKQPVLTKKMSRIARQAQNDLAVEFFSMSEFLDLKKNLPALIALEITTDSKDIFSTQLPQHLGIVIGSERHGISESLLSHCEKSIHIPMFGNKSSMNVSHALAVCMFEWRRQRVI